MGGIRTSAGSPHSPVALCAFWGVHMDLLHVYRLYRRMHQYPNLIGLMRSIFLDVLDQRGLVSRERLYARALEEMKKDDVPDTETNRLEYVEAVIDILVAQHLNPVDIE